LVNKQFRDLCDEEDLWTYLWRREFSHSNPRPGLGAKAAFQEAFGDIHLYLGYISIVRERGGPCVVTNWSAGSSSVSFLFASHFFAVSHSLGSELFVRDLRSRICYQDMNVGDFQRLAGVGPVPVIPSSHPTSNPLFTELSSPRTVGTFTIEPVSMCIPMHQHERNVTVRHPDMPFAAMAGEASNGWMYVNPVEFDQPLDATSSDTHLWPGSEPGLATLRVLRNGCA
jgi:hypothetical protein